MKSHTYALSRDTKCLRLDGLQAAFSNAVKPQGCIYGLCISKTAWRAKLIVTAYLASPVSCASLSHLLMAQHYHLCLNACFNLPTAPIHPTTHPNPLLPTCTHPLYTQSVILQPSKICLKNQEYSNT